MKFAPGRGNVKLMLQFSDGVEIWDLGKVQLRNNICVCHEPKGISRLLLENMN